MSKGGTMDVRRPLPLEGIIRASVGVFSNDTIFQESVQAELPRHGFKVSLTPLDSLGKIETPHDIYLIDLYGFNGANGDYERLANTITSVKAKNPDSKFVVFLSKDQLYAPELAPVRQADKTNITDDLYKRPVPTDSSESGRQSYREEIDQFLRVEILDYLTKILSKPAMIKIGGSIFDLVEKEDNPRVLTQLLTEIGELYQTHPSILIAGGGPRQDVEKTFMRQLQLPSPEFEYYSRGVLQSQARTIAGLLKRLGIDAVYVPPEDLHLLDVSGNYLRKHIPVVSLSNGHIPASESDTHALNIADAFALPEVKFAKNTDGIYRWDPNVKPYRLLERLRERGLNLFEMFGKKNEFLHQIRASEILEGRISRYGFDRDGTISDNHVIEAGALRFLLEQAKYVQRVHVINGTKPGTLKAALEGVHVGSYILKG